MNRMLEARLRKVEHGKLPSRVVVVFVHEGDDEGAIVEAQNPRPQDLVVRIMRFADRPAKGGVQ